MVVMDTNRVLIEAFDSLGELDGQRIRAPAIGAISVILVSLGAGQIIIPTPGNLATEHIREAVNNLPKQRRRMVHFADSKGRQLGRIATFLAPLREQAREWPEKTFVQIAGHALYLLTLACENNSSVIGADLSNIHSFLSIIRPSVFANEAKYRLAELYRLFTMYEPTLLDRLLMNGQVADPQVRSVLSSVIESSEYRELIASNGKLDYLRQPRIGLRRVKRAVLIASKREFRETVRAGMTVSSFAPPPLNVSGLREIIPDRSQHDRFAPPSIDMPMTTHFDICKAALAEFSPESSLGSWHALRRNGHNWPSILDTRRRRKHAQIRSSEDLTA